MEVVHLSHDSNSLLITTTMWKCSMTPWSLLLRGVFSAYAVPDTPNPPSCVVNAPWDVQEQPHPLSDVWGGRKRLNLPTLQMLQSSSSPFQTCVRHLKVLEPFGCAPLAHWICTSALLRRAAVMFLLSPWRHCIWSSVLQEPVGLCTCEQVGSIRHPARSWWLRCLGFLGFVSLLKPLACSQPPADTRSDSG